MRNSKELNARIAELKADTKLRKERLQDNWSTLNTTVDKVKRSWDVGAALLGLLGLSKSRKNGKWAQVLVPTLTSFIVGWFSRKKSKSQD